VKPIAKTETVSTALVSAMPVTTGGKNLQADSAGNEGLTPRKLRLVSLGSGGGHAGSAAPGYDTTSLVPFQSRSRPSLGQRCVSVLAHHVEGGPCWPSPPPSDRLSASDRET